VTQSDDYKPFDPATAPIMEEVQRFVAAGKLWAVRSITTHAEEGAWQDVKIIGVRPSDKGENFWEMVEIEGASPRRNLDRNLGGDDWEWPPKKKDDER
jgi:hypothetical protein